MATLLCILALFSLAENVIGYPRTYQEQRQIYYPVPFQTQQILSAHPQYLPQADPHAGVLYGQQPQSSLIPGSQQFFYVVPDSSGQNVLFLRPQDEGAETGGGGGYVDTIFNAIGNYLPSWPGSSETTMGAETPSAEPTTVKPASAGGEKKPEKVQQVIPLRQSQQVKAIQANQFQNSNRRNFYVSPHQAIQQPHNFYYNQIPSLDLSTRHEMDRPAISYQKLLAMAKQKANEAASIAIDAATKHHDESESTDQDESSDHGFGPSIAQAKPQAVSVAGPGGVASSAPQGTAVVGPGGMALAAPSATAVAGAKPRPQGSDETVAKNRANSYYLYY